MLLLDVVYGMWCWIRDDSEGWIWYEWNVNDVYVDRCGISDDE